MIEHIQRGEIYLADLNPISGCEQGGIRPVLVLQNDIGNNFSTTTIVAAITTNTKHKHHLPTHVSIESREKLFCDSIILLEQIRTVDRQRLIKKLTKLNEQEMLLVDKSLLISIGIMEIGLT